MLQVELVVNAVMYCQDLAAIVLALNKPPAEILKTVSSLHETGSGSIKDFYEKIPQRDFDYFWRMIKYDKLEITNEKDKYERSCERFRKDMLKVSKFFLHWYELFTAYKHTTPHHTVHRIVDFLPYGAVLSPQIKKWKLHECSRMHCGNSRSGSPFHYCDSTVLCTRTLSTFLRPREMEKVCSQ